jgi:hypothetical protein
MAIAKHIATGTPIAVSKNGEAVLVTPDTHFRTIARIWDSETVHE